MNANLDSDTSHGLSVLGVRHRDLKMENIMLSNDQHVKLIDFGLSKILPVGERTTTICGTLQYIAPEVLATTPYGHAVDWWSFGVLAYALLAGRFPYKAAKDPVSMIDMVSVSLTEFNISVHNPSAKSLLSKLLNCNPNQRLRSLDSLHMEPFFDFEKNLYQL